jgi:hypothetical protein
MFPASRFGNTKTFARPGTVEPGALRRPTASTHAASNWSSPSTSSCGSRARAMAVADRTLAADSCSALPFVLKESMATTGRSPVSARWVRAEATAMAASCSAVGSGTTAQSP